MPLGAIVQYIRSNIGSLNTLHNSVEGLETQLLRTDACKKMYRARCRCGNELDKSVTYKKSSDAKDGVFVKEDMKVMITDDLLVSPVSTLTSFELLKTLGISDASVLEALSLLRTSLISNTILSDVFCSKKPQQSRKRSSVGSVPSDKCAKTETECL
ncbi:hypothetical protein MRB53_035242 [Persea americana]|uniref:Uncharacterized protein n=1 Tax=Persea americana TaxID=3435 RepID=A0ACC2K473_PERAE|nr:hypothetical protein MRB53_035242 [Persea americana]